MEENKIFINVVSIPREILIDILSLLDPKSLSNLSKTCKFFYEFCKFDFFWLNMCKEFGIDKLGNFPNFYTMYTGILYKYGWLIGYWAGNKPINGSLLHLKFDPYKLSIIAWKLEAINKSLSGVPWSKNFSVRLVHAEPKFTYQMLFCVQYDNSKHKSKIIRSNLLYDEEDNNDEEFIIRKAIFEKHHESELWKREEEEIYQESIIGQQNCFSFEDEKFFKFWTPKDNQKENKRFDGIWVGDYGGHGIEFLLLKYEISGCLFATKITGDINVPRGEISWKCNLDDQLRICDEREWNGKISYRAKSKIAYGGFRNPSEIDSEVIIVSNDELAVYCFIHVIYRSQSLVT
ncbi:unnamed protein product [Rhizophagus irregularis]|uniref:F-box domain-containing protein n=1 Tax=Rhizophagus irregularis TaxID=588596 RepID=A0A916DZQ8_9GLOM|nr:unnamed protein product [Rhizophagus irregularis]CAB4478139.1 unnamed protein product [Rhizophagus irregularis]CAB5180085.1 unnamed protein product [Rhizophagus irregularis]CAB5324821.1 unnamed protein product [Rhizophagus irregularis]CAB5382051.1 unnamed protein product [Rhizophagus irregularis]